LEDASTVEISALFIRAAFLAMPGLLATILYGKLAWRARTRAWQDLTVVLLFAVASYLTVMGVVAVAERLGVALDLHFSFEAFLDEDCSMPWAAVAAASCVGVVLAFAASAAHQHKVFVRLGRLLRTSRRFGDEDVWDFFHNVPEIEWVFVRDHKLGVNYFGCVRAFSEPGAERELLLKDVQVFSDESGDLLYATDAVYLCRDRNELTIETPQRTAVASGEQPDSEVNAPSLPGPASTEESNE
jgi:hypothetical protein